MTGIVLILCATLVAIVAMLVRRPKTAAAGEICVKTGMWECSFCGELQHVAKGQRVPACSDDCAAHDAKWGLK